jgi:hypothetical protein
MVGATATMGSFTGEIGKKRQVRKHSRQCSSGGWRKLADRAGSR